ncbi:hypothetical protein C0J52_08969 [Blattella germanica]|nr:hypothetical protein C0J52_08969 [Blattella germanica]
MANMHTDSYHPSFSKKTIKLKIYKTVILPVILYGCETWTLSLREEKRYERLHNIIIRKIKSHRLRWAGHVARLRDERGGKRSVDRPRMKWEKNINHDLREVDCTGDDWKTLAQDRNVWRAYVRTAMNLRVR